MGYTNLYQKALDLGLCIRNLKSTNGLVVHKAYVVLSEMIAVAKGSI